MNRLYTTLFAVFSAVLIVSSLFVGVVYASHTGDVSDHQPDHVTVSYPESELAEYQPELQLNHLDVTPEAVYAAKYSSSQYTTDVYVYWAYYPVQQGYSGSDSHRLDREPVYVFVDSDSGDVEKVTYTQYHYLQETKSQAALDMDGKNVQLYAVNPHHHYFTEISGPTEKTTLRDFRDVNQAWYDNGWEANPDVVMNPWAIQNEDSWWEKSTVYGFEFPSMTEFKYEIQKTLSDISPF